MHSSRTTHSPHRAATMLASSAAILYGRLWRASVAAATAAATTVHHHRRRVRPLPGGHAQQRALSSSSTLNAWNDADDPFAVLGVGVEADEREIKIAFYASAKKLHPDAAAARGRDTKADFHKLCRAYEILSDPTLKAEYLLRKRHRHHRHHQQHQQAGGFDPWSRPPPAPRRARRSPVDEFNASLRRGRKAKARRAGLYVDDDDDDAAADGTEGREEAAAAGAAMMAEEPEWTFESAVASLDGGLLSALQKEFDEAMLFAYMGPRVEEGTIPWAFECEERRPLTHDGSGGLGLVEGKQGDEEEEEEEARRPSTESLHPHILQMTSGQQLLGYVEAAAEGSRPLRLAQTMQQAQRPEEEDEDAAGVGVGVGVGAWSHLSGLEAVEDEANFAPLMLNWQGIELAEAVRLRDPTKEGEDVIVVQVLCQGREHHHQHQQQHHPAWDGGRTSQDGREDGEEEIEGGSCYVIRGLGTTAALSQHPVLDARTGEATHVIICHKTPLVRHMHIMQVADRRVEVRLMRGWKPPSELWQFPPRSPQHDIGGWYIERAEVKEGILRRRQRLLHPAVYMLSCAYRTLDKEEEERRKAAGARARLTHTVKRMAKGWMEKLAL